MSALGVDRPLPTSPPRSPGSVRRTSYIDIVAPPTEGEVALMLRAGAQDVVSGHDGHAALLDRAALTVWLDRRMTVERVVADPRCAGIDDLIGVPAGRGFRTAARQAAGAAFAGPVGLLLDDVPVAALISGYAQLRSGALAVGIADNPATVLAMRDLCAGWRDGGTMMNSIDRGDGVPVPALADAPDLDRRDDPFAGDPPDRLAPGSLRRRRRIDVFSPLRDGTTPVEATFRDTFAGPDGVEGTLHEYLLSATVDSSGRLATLSAEPRVLPWPECPAAAGGLTGLTGTTMEELESALPVGTGSCTHLNDLLRSLAAVGVLIRRRPG